MWTIKITQFRKWHLNWELKDESVINQVKPGEETMGGNSACKGPEVWKYWVGLRNNKRLVCDRSMVKKGAVNMG